MVLSTSRALVDRMVDSTEEATVCEAILVAAVVESGGDVSLSSARQRACDALALDSPSSDAVERGRALRRHRCL